MGTAVMGDREGVVDVGDDKTTVYSGSSSSVSSTTGSSTIASCCCTTSSITSSTTTTGGQQVGIAPAIFKQISLPSSSFAASSSKSAQVLPFDAAVVFAGTVRPVEHTEHGFTGGGVVVSSSSSSMSLIGLLFFLSGLFFFFLFCSSRAVVDRSWVLEFDSSTLSLLFDATLLLLTRLYCWCDIVDVAMVVSTVIDRR